ncbi:epigen isoform X1 [Pelobates cultripes]|uniref:Epigen isoform X1 n=1 Tax=Pelobates cultripes TaxID=61616 RepID=A0AAD1SH39_PELCU|nr:epigen isoform X1 [Pelobates cultripes]
MPQSTASPRRNFTIIKTGDEDLEPKQQNNPCLDEFQHFCINGHCTFHKELRIPLCRCLSNYTGERCEQFFLASINPDDKATYLAIGIGMGLLISGLIAFIWCHVNKRGQTLWHMATFHF